jgi:hypothetical protein
MAEATKHRGAHSRGSHGGGGGHGDEGGGGGGGGGGGKLVKVGFARNQAEAEMLQGLLLDSDIPSILKRARGFDAPEFMAAGPHDIWVNAEHARVAREILEQTATAGDDEAEEREELRGEERLRETGGEPMSPARLALWLGGGFVVAIVLIWIVYQIT